MNALVYIVITLQNYQINHTIFSKDRFQSQFYLFSTEIFFVTGILKKKIN